MHFLRETSVDFQQRRLCVFMISFILLNFSFIRTFLIFQRKYSDKKNTF